MPSVDVSVAKSASVAAPAMSFSKSASVEASHSKGLEVSASAGVKHGRKML
jgi:hypothetical protein